MKHGYKTGLGAILVCSALALTACSGGGKSDFERLDERASALGDEVNALFVAEGYSDPAALPTTGDATYKGYIGIATYYEPVTAIGDLELTAHFDGPGTVTGSATNFVDDGNTHYSGTLNVTNGTIDRTANPDYPDYDYTFEADIGGTLSDSEDNYLVDGYMAGDFIGNDHDYVAGYTEGTVSSSLGDDYFAGVFLGAR